MFKSTFKVYSIGVFFKKKPTVSQIEITWKLKRTCNSKCLGSHAKSSVLFLFFCLKTQRKIGVHVNK